MRAANTLTSEALKPRRPCPADPNKAASQWGPRECCEPCQGQCERQRPRQCGCAGSGADWPEAAQATGLSPSPGRHGAALGAAAILHSGHLRLLPHAGASGSLTSTHAHIAQLLPCAPALGPAQARRLRAGRGAGDPGHTQVRGGAGALRPAQGPERPAEHRLLPVGPAAGGRHPGAVGQGPAARHGLRARRHHQQHRAGLRL